MYINKYIYIYIYVCSADMPNGELICGVGSPRCKTVCASRAANSKCRPSTIVLVSYFTPHPKLPRPMFGVGSPSCKKVFASRAASPKQPTPNVGHGPKSCSHLGQPAVNIGRHFFCILGSQLRMSASVSACRSNTSLLTFGLRAHRLVTGS